MRHVLCGKRQKHDHVTDDKTTCGAVFFFRMTDTALTRRTVRKGKVFKVSICLILKTVGYKSSFCAGLKALGEIEMKTIQKAIRHLQFISFGKMCICNSEITEEKPFGALKVKC